LTRADEPQWRSLWSDYLRFYESAVSEEVYATTFARLLSDDEPQHALIAEADGRLVGRALIEAVYAAADRNGTPSVYWMTTDNNARARLLYDRIGEVTPFIKYQRG
jgi:GNAT superfamily N-acetyltransferase